jgi:3-hydroxyisobutyrate dehydrogenase-like beta-hydroxyacid dehydrogenase
VPALEGRRAGLLDGRHAPPQFALRDLRKDLGLALRLFAGSRSSTPLTDLSSALVTSAAATTADLDISSVVQLYRKGTPAPRASASAGDPLAAPRVRAGP